MVAEIDCCYHAQQAGEKALKAYLTQFEQEIPYTHNLELLCKMCVKHDDAFSELFYACSDLTDYVTTTRYPGDDSVDIEEAEAALQKAGTIFLFIQKRII